VIERVTLLLRALAVRTSNFGLLSWEVFMVFLRQISGYAVEFSHESSFLQPSKSLFLIVLLLTPCIPNHLMTYVCLNNRTLISEKGVIFRILIGAPNPCKTAFNCTWNGPRSTFLRPVVDIIKKIESVK